MYRDVFFLLILYADTSSSQLQPESQSQSQSSPLHSTLLNSALHPTPLHSTPLHSALHSTPLTRALSLPSTHQGAQPAGASICAAIHCDLQRGGVLKSSVRYRLSEDHQQVIHPHSPPPASALPHQPQPRSPLPRARQILGGAGHISCRIRRSPTRRNLRLQFLAVPPSRASPPHPPNTVVNVARL